MVRLYLCHTLPGEQVEIEITSIQKNFSIGKATKYLVTGSSRRNPPCPFYESCGGCALMHMDYDAQLKVKENIVQDAITRIGKLEYKVNPIIGATSEVCYRNKAAFPVKNGKIGYYHSASHTIVEIDRCPLVCNRINEVLTVMKPFVHRFPN
ncbi:MAG: hypothetical protein IIW54_00765, partial [Lachnospiraceae bacterium]|nr:hypothetical protein [Lachnospiraceae bacterium]